MSRLGVPARLRGREKLNDGLGKGDDSDPTDGDLWFDPNEGDIIGGPEKALLLEDSLRVGREWNDVLITASSSVGSKGDDMMLEERFENRGRGGASAAVSKDPLRFVECSNGWL
jgi:hypothetical protein